MPAASVFRLGIQPQPTYRVVLRPDNAWKLPSTAQLALLTLEGSDEAELAVAVFEPLIVVALRLRLEPTLTAHRQDFVIKRKPNVFPLRVGQRSDVQVPCLCSRDEKPIASGRFGGWDEGESAFLPSSWVSSHTSELID
jgi:hypothetical protein